MNTESLKKLHIISFGDSEYYADFFFAERLLPGNAYVRTENGEAVSAVYVRPITLETPEGRRQIPFFTGVATLPAYRGRGLCRALMKEAEEDLRARGNPYALLHPFSHDFYAALGFETVNHADRVAGNAEAEAVSRLVPMGADDYAVAAELYDRITAGSHARELRPAEEMRLIFREHFGDGGKGYLLTENGNPEGYVLLFEDKGREAVFSRAELLNGHGELRGFDFPRIIADGKPYTMAIPLNASRKEFEGLKNILMYQKY